MKKLAVKTSGFTNKKKIFLFQSGNYSVSESESLPENAVLGADIPEESGVYTVVSSLGSYVIKVAGATVYVTSTGSRDDYSYQYDLDIIPPVDGFNTYFLTNARAASSYFSGFAVRGNRLIATNDHPMAFDLTTGEIVWDLIDEKLDISHVADDGKMFAHEWFSTFGGYTETDFAIYSVDIETGAFNKYITSFPFNASFLKPNGELLLLNSVGNDGRIFRETESGFELREITDATLLYTLSTVSVNMHPSVDYFAHSKDGSMYYLTDPWSDNVITAVDTETDTVVWYKDYASLDMVNYAGDSIAFHPDVGFLLTYIDSVIVTDDITIEILDMETGESIDKRYYLDTTGLGDGDDYAPQYYNTFVFSHSGEKFMIGTEYKDSIFFDTATLQEIGRSLQVGDYSENPILGANDVCVMCSDANGLQFIDFNTNTVINVPTTDPYTVDVDLDVSYSHIIPHDGNFYTVNENGSVLLLTEGESGLGRKSNTPTPTLISGNSLAQGWYYDNGETDWTPPSFLVDAFSKTRITHDLGNGSETLLASTDGTNYSLYRYVGGEWVEHVTRVLPYISGSLFKSAWISYNSGYTYPFVSQAAWPNIHNLITGDTKTIPTVANLDGRPFMLDNIEYFFSRGGVTASARAFNHTTNTWSVITKNPANGSPGYITSYNGDIYTFTYNNLAGFSADRETIARRYNVSLNTWTTLSTCPEGVVPNPELIYDSPFTHNEFVFMPSSGYIYNMALDTWEFIGIEPRQANKYAFNAGRIHYSIPYALFYSSSVLKTDYVAAAYALPGAIAPY